MDFAILDKALRIKTKNATLLVNPNQSGPQEADASLFFSRGGYHKNTRLNIQGPGDYEVSGVKISAEAIGEKLFYLVEADNLKVGIGQMSQIAGSPDKIPNSQVIVVDSDAQLNMGNIIAKDPSVVILYGDSLDGVEKAVGTQVPPTNKYSVTFEKLPEETQTVVIKS